MNAQHVEILRRNLISAAVVFIIAATGWLGRGWLEAQASNWPSVQFTLQAGIPAILFAVWCSTHHIWIKSVWVRIGITLLALGVLAWWANQLIMPFGYEWSQAIPVLVGLVVALLAGISLLAWVKPHLAGWPWWR